MNPRNLSNFSAGPGVLPESVLQQLQEAIVAVPETGLSVLGISHRSDWFANVICELETNFRRLLNIPQNYHILFMQGGATQQFSQVALTLLQTEEASADYLHTGYWSGKAISEAQRVRNIRTAWQGQATRFRRLPDEDEIRWQDEAKYLHYVSNETVEGLQFNRIVGPDSTLRICDMSSDLLSRPIDVSRFALIYAHAQKNIGPAGVTIVIVRDDILANCPQNLPSFLDYRTQAEAHSNYNTPPVFAIYTVLLVTRWLLHDVGSLAKMAEHNQAKAARLYAYLDAQAEFYLPRVERAHRSLMNATFNLSSVELEHDFVMEADAAGFSGLGGHRSLGGVRASLYNALPQSAVDALIDFMEVFRKKRTS